MAECETSNAGFRQYRAPRSNGETFIDPELSRAGVVAKENRTLFESNDSLWHRLRQEARAQLITDAIRYTSVYRDTNWVAHETNSPIIMAGHQPSLFHPGVWFKNFALSRLSRTLGATGVNLVVDNDVAKGGSIRVPTIGDAGTLASTRVVRYDDFGGGVPYEQTTIGNLELFRQFAANVRSVVSPLVQNPCVTELWPHALNAIDRCGVAGCALAQARHGLEAQVGLRTLELPLGVVCRSRPFLEFVFQILSELPRFHQSYNDSTETYRAAHGIRSNAHPVPNLGQTNDWFEAPFWVYGNQSPNRKPVWVRCNGDELEVSDLDKRSIRITTNNVSDAVDQLQAVITPEFKLRPRALLTTMYSRLVLSDLFLHGIGGGKYDQLGDMIIRSFFAVEPPGFMVLSATIHLPGTQPNDVLARIRQLRRSIRETHFQGERFADRADLGLELVEEKRSLLERIPPRGQRPTWHREITSVNLRLSATLSSLRGEFLQSLRAAEREAASQSVLESREHPFCVYPLDYLVDAINKMLDRR